MLLPNTRSFDPETCTCSAARPNMKHSKSPARRVNVLEYLGFHKNPRFREIPYYPKRLVVGSESWSEFSSKFLSGARGSNKYMFRAQNYMCSENSELACFAPNSFIWIPAQRKQGKLARGSR